jgi:hypothetical protein
MPKGRARWLITNHNLAPILSIFSFYLEKFRWPILSENVNGSRARRERDADTHLVFSHQFSVFSILRGWIAEPTSLG